MTGKTIWQLRRERNAARDAYNHARDGYILYLFPQYAPLFAETPAETDALAVAHAHATYREANNRYQEALDTLATRTSITALAILATLTIIAAFTGARA